MIVRDYRYVRFKVSSFMRNICSLSLKYSDKFNTKIQINKTEHCIYNSDRIQCTQDPDKLNWILDILNMLLKYQKKACAYLQ